jgi:hypothetical protein
VIIINLYFFFFYFPFVLTGLYFGVIHSSKINDCLKSTIGDSGGAHLTFDAMDSCFCCNGNPSGYFRKGWQLDYVIQFFFLLLFGYYFYFIFTSVFLACIISLYLKSTRKLDI